MKVRAYVLIVSVALLAMSSGTKDAKPTEGLNPGDFAPRIEFLENDGESVSFRNHSGRYTLLNFWAAYDAESRAGNVRLANEVNKLGPDRVAMYGVSFDKNQSVFEETVKADRLQGTIQRFEGLGEESALYKKFGLKKGFRNFLIDDKGVIIASDVTPGKLAEVLKAI